MTKHRKNLKLAAAAGLVGSLLSLAEAHTVWLEPVADDSHTFTVLFGGHGGNLLTLVPDKLKSVAAVDGAGALIALDPVEDSQGMQVLIPERAVMVLVHYDNGIWSRNPMGRSINQPMNEVSGAASATWAIKYHKTVLDWADGVAEPAGQDFEVVPMHARQPLAGEPFRVKVLIDGEPAAGVKLGHSEEAAAIETDALGFAEFTPEAGRNRLWAGKRFAVDEATHTQLSYEYMMIFEARSP